MTMTSKRMILLAVIFVSGQVHEGLTLCER